jgi:hypothetical protein
VTPLEVIDGDEDGDEDDVDDEEDLEILENSEN